MHRNIVLTHCNMAATFLSSEPTGPKEEEMENTTRTMLDEVLDTQRQLARRQAELASKQRTAMFDAARANMDAARTLSQALTDAWLEALDQPAQA